MDQRAVLLTRPGAGQRDGQLDLGDGPAARLAAQGGSALARPAFEGYTSEDSIRDSAWALRPIALDDLVESADLQTRVDRKYFVPAKTFRLLIAELGATFRVLEIDGQRTFDYESVYFDTPDLLTHRAHLQRRRRRFKSRTRTYLDSGLC